MSVTGHKCQIIVKRVDILTDNTGRGNYSNCDNAVWYLMALMNHWRPTATMRQRLTFVDNCDNATGLGHFILEKTQLEIVF